MFHRRPTAFSQIPPEASLCLARLSGIEGFSGAILVNILPLVALDALGSKEAVVKVYLVGAILTLFITLNIATLERVLQRRWVVSLVLLAFPFHVLFFVLAGMHFVSATATSYLPKRL